MASIQKRPNCAWRARYRDQTGKEYAKHFKLKRDAQNWLDEKTASIITGQYVDPSSAKITFREYGNTWLNAQVHRESTAALYKAHLERNAYPTLGDLQLGNILPSTIQAWVKRLSVGVEGERPGLSPTTVSVAYRVVASIFKAAVRDRKLATTPCMNISLPEVIKTRVRPLATEQVDLLIAHLPESLKALVILAAGTGLRQGEALGLTRDRLRLLGVNPEVTINRQLLRKTKKEAVFGPPKTKASIRAVPLPQVVIAALNDHIAKYDVSESGLLFTRKGGPITRQKFSELWQPAAKAAGLTEETGKGMHSLRHYYASLLIRYGESVKVVQARLGHNSASETLDTYSHLWEDSDDRTRDAVDSVLLHRGDSADSLRTVINN